MKHTKQKLIISIASLLMSLTMMIGSTYAWFSDNASTGVNKIESGTLDIQILNGEGNSIENSSLHWMKNGNPNDSIKWEPGATYHTQPFQIKNGGDLSLKFKLSVNGIESNSVLNTEISFYISTHPETDNTWMEVKGNNGIASKEYYLKPGQYWDGTDTASNDPVTVYLVAHMDEDAGNNCQGQTLDNIGITLAATQYVEEEDSFSHNYDINAVYPVVPSLSNASLSGTIKTTGVTTIGDIYSENNATPAMIEIPAGAVNEDTAVNFNMTLTGCNPDSVTYEISLKTGNDPVTLQEPAKVTANIGAGLSEVSVKHGNEVMTGVNSASDLDDQEFYYNPYTGDITICTLTFSPFEISYQHDYEASVEGTGYSSIHSAIAAATEGQKVVLQKDIEVSTISFKKKITLDLNGHKISYKGESGQMIQLLESADVTIKNGSLTSTNHGIVIFNENAKLTLDKVNLTSSAVGVFGYANGINATVDKCDIHSAYFGVYQNGSFENTIYTLTNSTITDTYGAGVYISNSLNKQKQNITIDTCTITGPTAVEIKHTNADIRNSHLIATTSPIASGENGNGSCTDGYSFAATTNGASDYVTGTVTVADTTFGLKTEGQEEIPGYVFVYQVADGNTVTVNGTPVSSYNTYGGEEQK